MSVKVFHFSFESGCSTEYIYGQLKAILMDFLWDAPASLYASTFSEKGALLSVLTLKS